MGKKNSISFRTVFYYIVIIGFLFPRGYGEINTTYHSVCSLFMWISVVLVLIQSLNKTKIKVSIRKIKIHKENIWLRGYFIAAILITAFCRKSFSSGLQQLFAAPCVCIFMLLNLKQYPEKILNIIISPVILLLSMFEKIYWYPLKNGYRVDLIDRFIDFFKNDSVIVFWLLWFPGIIVFTILNIWYLSKTKSKG